MTESSKFTVPDEAVEAAAKAFYGTALDDVSDEDMAFAIEGARLALEAAAPHMLSHEREQTRLAHVDAVVNAETVGVLQQKLDRVEALADHWVKQGGSLLYYAKRIRHATQGNSRKAMSG
jgi:hypothetical protein